MKHPYELTRLYCHGNYRYEIDFELKDEWMDRLNEIAEIVSVCSGHPKGSIRALNIGGDEHPGFNLKVDGWDLAESIFNMRVPFTKVSWSSWANWGVTYSNGKPRTDLFTGEELDKGLIDDHSLCIDSEHKHNGKNQSLLAGWWESVIPELKAILASASQIPSQL